ncbi:MAG: 16S rRNA (cytosine(1402)-N(4))-methyltransferase RsmH [Candidatus Spyradocola sp.]|nr:16S rRNA (cytosine(1402)-N(4))-methyltransferase RsmH [Candidatus Spyradocola sp.]
MEFKHIPVMLEECMELLNLAQRPTGVFVDGTLGGGGHTEQILERTTGKVIGIDRDWDALRAAGARLSPFGDRFVPLHGNYANIKTLLQRAGFDGMDGMLMDLGVSSYQLDNPERGFSFHNDAPLDMRMDQTAELTAEKVLNTYPEKELVRIISQYGEEKWAVRIAKFIVAARPLHTTMDLVRVIDAAVPAAERRKVSHPARRTFQAIRIEVNSELSLLEPALRDAVDCLKPGGRLVVITFHSLEDRIVKQTFQSLQNPCTCPPKAPVCICGKKPLGRVVTRKPVLPTQEECERNLRSHSAKVRAFEKREMEP